MKVSLSGKGLGLTLSLASLTVIAAAVKDPVIAAAALIIAAAFIADALITRKWVKGKAGRVEPKINVRAWVWEEPEVELRATCGLRNCSIKAPQWLRIKELIEDGGELSLKLKAVFQHYGVYELSNLIISGEGPLGILKFTIGLPADIKFTVYPETLYWLVIAYNVLGVGRGAGFSAGLEETMRPSPLRSLGGTYYETREYIPGDPLKRIDWKATARRQRLMVKEYREELTGNVTLAYDPRCLGPHTCDVIASSALSTAIAAVRQGIPLNRVYDLRNDKLLIFRSTRELLTYLVADILKGKVVEDAEIYEFVEPLSLDELRKYLKLMMGKQVIIKSITPPTKALSDGGVTIVASMLHGIQNLLTIVEESRRNGKRATIIAPPRPWIDVGDVEEAYRIYRTFNLVVNKLRGMGAEIVFWGRGREVKAVGGTS